MLQPINGTLTFNVRMTGFRSFLDSYLNETRDSDQIDSFYFLANNFEYIAVRSCDNMTMSFHLYPNLNIYMYVLSLRCL